MDLKNIMLTRFFHFAVGLVLVYNICQSMQHEHKENQPKFENWRFKDFMKKFDPDVASDRIRTAFRARGLNHSSAEYIDSMIHAMDETDDLMKLKVQNIGPPINSLLQNMSKDARRWQPGPGLSSYSRDPFDLRVRLYELMRQAVYQARNSMVIMQTLREKYRNSSLYKMGFLICKTDNAVKTFSKFAFRVLRQCGLTRTKLSKRMFAYETLLTEERLVHLWFNAQLLIELVNTNDETCAQALNEHQTDRVKNWKYVD